MENSKGAHWKYNIHVSVKRNVTQKLIALSASVRKEELKPMIDITFYFIK